jgi:hypothetical protein
MYETEKEADYRDFLKGKLFDRAKVAVEWDGRTHYDQKDTEAAKKLYESYEDLEAGGFGKYLYNVTKLRESIYKEQ